MTLGVPIRAVRPKRFAHYTSLFQIDVAQCRPFSSSSMRCSILGLDRPVKWNAAPSPAQLEMKRRIRRLDPRRPKCYPQPSGAYSKVCKDPLKAVNDQQLAVLDPSGARRRLFDRKNPESAKVGDILLVRNREGDPFAGVCMDIRHRGVDTSILLRGNLTRVGVEMKYKIFNPTIQGIEIVQRRQRKVRRARLFYMRLPKHDVGSVENVVRRYIKQKQALRSGEKTTGRDADSHRKHGKDGNTKKGKRGN